MLSPVNCVIFLFVPFYQFVFGLCPPQFFTISSSKSCFLIVRQRYSWVDSRVVCRRYGADLVSIRHPFMMSQIHNKSKQAGVDAIGYWLGLNDIRSEGEFHWTDGSLDTLKQFQYGQPNGGVSQNCVFRSSLYFALHDAVCSLLYSPVCELDQGKFGRGLEMKAVRMEPFARALACSHVVEQWDTRSTLECAAKCVADQACDMFTYKRDVKWSGICLLLIFGGKCGKVDVSSYHRSYERIRHP